MFTIAFAAADARSIITASGVDDAAANGDVAAIGQVNAAADARTTGTASGRDVAAADGDAAARRFIAATADARSIPAAIGRDGAAADGDVAARGLVVAAADARTIVTASSIERAVALEGEGMALGYVDARTPQSPLHVVGHTFGQDDDGIAQAGDARPPVVTVVVVGGDGHAA